MPDEDRFNPRRLDLARRRRGLTQSELSERVDIDRRTLFSYDAGEFQPTEAVVSRLAEELEFPPSFFYGPDLDEPAPDTASFRAMSKQRARTIDAALAQGALALSVGRWIEGRFNLLPANLPDLSREPSPEVAAEALRKMWGLGEKPVKNAVHLLESRGVRVFSMDLETREVDAFSLWKGETALVLLNQYKSAEHSRFDACHELGHLVLHRHGSLRGSTKSFEREAHEFASALLMPRASVLRSAPKFATVAGLITLKRKWGVSVAALAYRLHQVGALSDWQYRTLYAEIGRRGYRTTEPEPMGRETSQVLGKVMTLLRDEGIGKAAAAQQLDLSPRELDRLVFGLTLTALPGGAPADSAAVRGPDPKLRIVGATERPSSR